MSRDSREIDRIASEWLAHRHSGNWSEDDTVRFEEWLRTSTVHRVAFLRLELAWEDTGRLKALAAGVRSETPPPPGQWHLSPFFDAALDRVESPLDVRALAEADGVCAPEVPRPTQVGVAPDMALAIVPRGTSAQRRGFAVAASVLIAAILVSIWYVWPGGERYATPVGGIASVPMLDGSKITLNTNSQIRVALTEVERRVDLKQGEAFFEVAKDENRPFVVEAGKKRVVAIGTKFSVRREGDSIQVVVTEGKVRVEDTAQPLRSNAVEAPGSATPEGAEEDAGGPVFLTPGTIVRAGLDGMLVQRKTLPEAEAALSWRAGVLTFRNETLADAIAEFNRYSARRVVIADPTIESLKIEGNFRSNNVPAFLKLLEEAFPVRVTDEADRIVLTSR